MRRLGPSRRTAIDTKPANGRRLYNGESGPLTKRAVPMPTPEERKGTHGACLYACREGHVWIVLVVRDARGFVPADPADVYCEEDPCASDSDENALGRKVSAVRHWTMR